MSYSSPIKPLVSPIKPIPPATSKRHDPREPHELEYIDSGIAQRSQDLIFSILDPSRVSTSECDATPTEKVQTCTALLQRMLRTQQGRYLRTLSKLVTDVPSSGNLHDPKFEPRTERKYLVHVIAAIAFSTHDQSIRIRAIMALQNLAKHDPLLDSLVYALKTRNVRALTPFFASEPKPLHVHFPIRPFSSPTLPLVDRSYIVENRQFHNAFWTIRRIVLGRAAGCFLDNLGDIQRNEGFHLSRMNIRDGSFSWFRDCMLIMDDGRIIVPQQAHFDESFRKMARKLNRDLPTDTMGVVEEHRSSETLLKSSIPNLHEAPFYFEGGNVLRAFNRDGEEVYIWGGSNLTYSILNSAQTFHNHKQRLLEEMKRDKERGIKPTDIEFIRLRLKPTGLLQGFSDEEVEFIATLTLSSINCLRDWTSQYLGKKVIIPSFPFKPQPAFHLDIFMAAAPGGVIFLNDFSLCLTAIENIFAVKPLSKRERERLQKYYDFAQEYDAHFGEELDKIGMKLETQGFNVVRVPGVYYASYKQISLRLLNSIFGIGPEGTYCITNGGKYSADRH
jgi:hypothetical protein